MLARVDSIVHSLTMGFTFVAAVIGILYFSSSTSWSIAGYSCDSLSLFFILVLLIGQGISSLYGMSYMREFEGKKSLLTFSVSWLVFIGSMLGVLLVKDGFTFLFFWELMSLFSFFLVAYEHEIAANRRSAFIYLVMTHVGTVFLMAAVLFLYGKTGSFVFTTWAESMPELSQLERNLLFICFLVGLGTKAGLVPFHIWLPYAHPVAPSPVSALMSGVMVKVAFYMMLRLIWLTLNPMQAWWGWTILFLGILSAFVGILYASIEQDVKRLLAYSTVENVGILAMALGAAILAEVQGFSGLAQLALVAMFWHTLQHMLFKSTMFMAAGNLIQAVHSHRLENYGGLLKRLPRTGFWALLGAMGLAALPPFGGFWGEWLLFHSLWETSRQVDVGMYKLLLPIAIAILGMVSAIALATMVKWFSSAFLGQARTDQARDAKELPRLQTSALAIAMCLAISIIVLPQKVLKLILLPVSTLSASSVYGQTGLAAPTIVSTTSPFIHGVFNLNAFTGFYHLIMTFSLSLCFIAGFIYLLGRGRQKRVSSSWNCGTTLTPRMQYTSLGITMPIRIFFKRFLGSKPVIQKEFGLNRYILKKLSYRGRIREIYEETLYRPSRLLLLWCADQIKKLQDGSIHVYLGYMLLTLVIVLIGSL